MCGLAAVAAAGGGSHVSVPSGRSTVGLVTNDWGNEAATVETVAAVFISTFSSLRALRTTILASLAPGTQTNS